MNRPTEKASLGVRPEKIRYISRPSGLIHLAGSLGTRAILGEGIHVIVAGSLIVLAKVEERRPKENRYEVKGLYPPSHGYPQPGDVPGDYNPWLVEVSEWEWIGNQSLPTGEATYPTKC